MSTLYNSMRNIHNTNKYDTFIINLEKYLFTNH